MIGSVVAYDLSTTPTPQMIGQESTHFLQFAIQWSSIALLYYDYLLTLPMEIKYMWNQKFRTSTLLYVFCRYGLVANVIYLLTIAELLKHRSVDTGPCDTGYKISSALSVFGRSAIIMVWSARTWAVFARSRIVLVFFVLVGTACIVLDICYNVSTTPVGHFGGILSILMCLFEFSSAGLTSFRSVQALKIGGPWKTQKQGFMYLLFEQGLLYFGAVSMFTIASLALNITIPGGFLQRLLNALTLPLSGLMTARFLLHLRHWDHKHEAIYLGTPLAGTRTHGPWHVRSRPLTAMRFAHTQGTNTIMATIMSVQDEFGEDPVRRAEADIEARDGRGRLECLNMSCGGLNTCDTSGLEYPGAAECLAHVRGASSESEGITQVVRTDRLG